MGVLSSTPSSLENASQFRAKSAKNDPKPTGFPKRNSFYETEGVTICVI
jgi:hypothetical protein